PRTPRSRTPRSSRSAWARPPPTPRRRAPARRAAPRDRSALNDPRAAVETSTAALGASGQGSPPVVRPPRSPDALPWAAPGEGVRMTEEGSPRLTPRDRGAERERTARRRRRGLTIAAAVLVVAALVVGQLAFGLITRVVKGTGWACGRGWARVGTDELDGPPV